MRVLVTSPEVDGLTRYLRVWSKRLIKRNNKKHDFLCLDGKKATRKRTMGMISKKRVDAVLFNGHGSDCEVAGYDEVIFDTDSAEMLNGKVVHALSCHTAKTLGPKAIQCGAKEYVGYDEKFVALLQNDKIGHPEEDDTAALFLDPAFVAQEALLDGKSGQEAVTLAKKAYNRSILKALNSDVQSDNDQFIGWLLWDREHLKSCRQ